MTEELNDEFGFIAIKLSVFLIFVFIIQTVYDYNPGYNPGVSPAINFFTAIFGHSSLQHLGSNLFFIALFGSIYERYTSTEMFLFTFLASGWIANLTSFIFFYDSFIIGASGGAMGLLAALAVYRPRQLGIGLGVPMPMWAVLISYIVIDLAGITGANNIANEAHLLGMVVGLLIGYNLRNQPLIFDESQDSQSQNEESDFEKRIREWEEKYMLN